MHIFCAAREHTDLIATGALCDGAVGLADENGALDVDRLGVGKLEHGKGRRQPLGLRLGVEAGAKVRQDVRIHRAPQVVRQVVVGALLVVRTRAGSSGSVGHARAQHRVSVAGLPQLDQELHHQ